MFFDIIRDGFILIYKIYLTGGVYEYIFKTHNFDEFN